MKNDMNQIVVVKRNGKKESVKLEKILHRIDKESYGLNSDWIQPIEVAKKVIAGIYSGVTTRELDQLSIETAASLTTKHPDYATLAARLAISTLHKDTKRYFSESVSDLYNFVNPETGLHAPLVSKEFYDIVNENADELDSAIVSSRDFMFDYFGYKTLEKSYLLKINGKVSERPQYLFMRTAIGIHGKDIESVLKTYDLISQGYFTHATPTLFNSGMPRPQLASCFIAGTKISTINDGVKNIEDVKIGDLVVTHKGNIKPVLQLHKNPLNNRILFNLKCLRTPNIVVTDNHEFLSITKEQIKWKQKPTWNSVEKLRVGDYIATPKINVELQNNEYEILDIYEIIKNIENNYQFKYEYILDEDKITLVSKWNRKHKLNNHDKIVEVTKKHNTINRYWKIDENFAKLLGMWYGDGNIITSTNLKKDVRFNRGINMTIHNLNETFISNFIAISEDIFGVTPKYYENYDGTINLSIHSNIIGEVFNHLFGKHFNNKKLYKNCLKWNLKMFNSLLIGLISSDGCVTKEGDVRITMSNKKFIRDVYNNGRNLGILLSYTESGKNATVSLPKKSELIKEVHKNYTDNRLTISREKKSHQEHILEIDGVTYVRINNKELYNETKPDFVYTLGVQDDHSYSVDGIMAKNCFLMQIKDDSIDGIFETLKDCALISKNAGGIGISVSNIRATGSYITGTNGNSNGLIPFLKIYNETARAVDQGGGKRKGSFAVYIEPWHGDILEFLDLKKNHGKEELRARDLFYAIWMPDLFMQRVEKDLDWSLMCPNECPGLTDVYGEDFVALYEKYEADGKFRKKVKARDIWYKILEAQMETGTPYIAYKDSANVKSNQKNLGTLKTSNLCIEILEFVAPDEIAVCNLASICLPKFVKGKSKLKIDHDKLREVAYQATVNLNKVIDVTYYPVESAKRSNLRHRPVGLGVQGLADVFFLMNIPFESDEAKKINAEIFETIYYGAVQASNDLAKIQGRYDTFDGSPASKGLLQFDMWGVTPNSGRWDWTNLKLSVMEHGLRNSLMTAIMPTASTASIFGNEASTEAQTSNMYTRRVLSGEFIIVNKHLVRSLCELNLWNDDMKQLIIANNGSVQNIHSIPQELRDVYKTVWEISQKNVIDMYADRGAYIDQTQSMNVFMSNPNFAKLTSMHFYGWGGGVTKNEKLDEKYGATPQKALKTGIYYLRSQAAADAIKFTVDPNLAKSIDVDGKEYDANSQMSCSLDDPDNCIACSA